MIALASNADVVAFVLWQAIVIPAAALRRFGVDRRDRLGLADGDDGAVDAFRDALERRGAADAVVSATALGVAVTVATPIGGGAVVLAGAVAMSVARSSRCIQAGNVDILGAIVVTLGQVAYLPTLIVWTISSIAGPGFAIGTGTTVSPVGTDLAVVPSIPVLGPCPTRRCVAAARRARRRRGGCAGRIIARSPCTPSPTARGCDRAASRDNPRNVGRVGPRHGRNGDRSLGAIGPGASRRRPRRGPSPSRSASRCSWGRHPACCHRSRTSVRRRSPLGDAGSARRGDAGNADAARHRG